MEYLGIRHMTMKTEIEDLTPLYNSLKENNTLGRKVFLNVENCYGQTYVTGFSFMLFNHLIKVHHTKYITGNSYYDDYLDWHPNLSEVECHRLYSDLSKHFIKKGESLIVIEDVDCFFDDIVLEKLSYELTQLTGGNLSYYPYFEKFPVEQYVAKVEGKLKRKHDLESVALTN